MRAQGPGAIRTRRINYDTNFDIRILTLELRDHLRLRCGPWIIRVVRVEERVVGDFNRLRDCDRGHRDDDSECGDQMDDALPRASAACCAALRKRLALMDCSHRFLRCRSLRLGTAVSNDARSRRPQVSRRAGRSYAGEAVTTATSASCVSGSNV